MCSMDLADIVNVNESLITRYVYFPVCSRLIRSLQGNKPSYIYDNILNIFTKWTSAVD